MSMAVGVYGIIPPSEKWKKMKSVYDACRAADTGIPQEVWTFFNDEPPDPCGVVIELDVPRAKGSPDMTNWYEVEIDKLPKDVKIIRFSNSF